MTSPSAGLRRPWGSDTEKEKVSTASGQVDLETKFILHQDPTAELPRPTLIGYSDRARWCRMLLLMAPYEALMVPYSPQLTTPTVSLCWAVAKA